MKTAKDFLRGKGNVLHAQCKRLARKKAAQPVPVAPPAKEPGK